MQAALASVQAALDEDDWDDVERVADEGAGTIKQFMREAIEDGRRSFKSRVRSTTVPGRTVLPANMSQCMGIKTCTPRSRASCTAFSCHCTASPPSKSRAAASGSGIFT